MKYFASTKTANPLRPTSASKHTVIDRNVQRILRINFLYGVISMACVGLILRLSYLQIRRPHSSDPRP